MPVLTEAVVIELLDGIACALMAASATWKAASLRVQLAGATVLGCICGIIGPLFREFILHGETGSRLIMSALANEAFIGALAGLAAYKILKKPLIFFIIDRSAVFLSSSLAIVLIVGDLGLTASLIGGIICGFVPIICRDAALGDRCELVEGDWFASCAVIAGSVTLLLSVLPFFLPLFGFMEARIMEWSIILGVGFGMAIAVWKGRDGL